MPILPPLTAYVLLLVLALALYALGARVPRHARRWAFAVGLVLSLPALIYTLYYTHLYEDAPWLLALRTMPLAEYYAAGMGLPAGVLSTWLPESRWANRLKHSSLPLLTGLWLAVPFVKPILVPATLQPMHDQWEEGVCLQSTGSTCGPACAATLLSMHGIQVTEEQLARMSWSSVSGTENWYLTRAIRTLGGNVRYVRTAPNPERLPYPAIAGVLMNGKHGAGHFITVLGEEHGQYLIGDPLVGWVDMPSRVHPQYYFTGMFMMVERKDNSSK